jgi:hypothetical protein
MDSPKSAAPAGKKTARTAAGGADGPAWLTTVLRPAGSLDRAAAGRLGPALHALAAASDLVLLDLSAAEVRNPRALAAALRAPAAAFAETGRCLLVTGADAALTAELERAEILALTVAGDALAAA